MEKKTFMVKNTHLLMDICSRCTLELPHRVHIGNASMRQFQCVPTTYLTENKEPYFEIYLSRIMSISFASLKHLNLPISIKMANCLYLHDSYITRYFMNYAFESWYLHGCIIPL